MYDCAVLAGKLGVKKNCKLMAGLPAGNETDTTPNWITSTVSWPDFMAPAYEYQWKVTIEFWKVICQALQILWRRTDCH